MCRHSDEADQLENEVEDLEQDKQAHDANVTFPSLSLSLSLSIYLSWYLYMYIWLIYLIHDL